MYLLTIRDHSNSHVFSKKIGYFFEKTCSFMKQCNSIQMITYHLIYFNLCNLNSLFGKIFNHQITQNTDVGFYPNTIINMANTRGPNITNNQKPRNGVNQNKNQVLEEENEVVVGPKFINPTTNLCGRLYWKSRTYSSLLL